MTARNLELRSEMGQEVMELLDETTEQKDVQMNAVKREQQKAQDNGAYSQRDAIDCRKEGAWRQRVPEGSTEWKLTTMLLTHGILAEGLGLKSCHLCNQGFVAGLILEVYRFRSLCDLCLKAFRLPGCRSCVRASLGVRCIALVS